MLPPVEPIQTAPAEGEAPAPLWAVLFVAFLASIGTGVVTNGIYFITRHAYGFGDAGNYLLGLVLGGTYIAGALAAGPILRWLAASRSVNTRDALAAILVILGLLCAIPVLGRGAGGAWPVWLLIALYSPLTGVVWPIVESYVAGGRRGASMRSAVGRFNWTWSGAIVAAYIVVSPALPDAGDAVADPRLRGAVVIAALGVLHLLTTAFLAPWPPEPGRHAAESHESHPATYRGLLVTFRILLPASYVVLTALLPYLPRAFDRLGVPPSWHMTLAATWLAARVFAFVALERSQGWHGRWWPPVAGGMLLLAGFGAAVLAPALAAPPGGRLALMLAGLALFGTGMAIIYCGALYYALEVGDGKVEAGGMHEALIGIGYTLGPTLGLVAVGAARVGFLPSGSFEAALLGTVAIVAAVAAAAAVTRSYRATRAASPDVTPP